MTLLKKATKMSEPQMHMEKVISVIGFMLLVFSLTNYASGAVVQLAQEEQSTSEKQLVLNKEMTENQQQVSLQVEDTSLISALRLLAKEVQIGFSFQEYVIPDKKVTVSFNHVPIYEALDTLLEGTNLEVELSPDRDILIIREKLNQELKIQLETVRGTVTDAQSGETLPGVNVMVKGTTTGTSTGSGGNYELDAPSLQDTLIFSFVGYQTRELPISGRTEIDVSLQPQAIAGEEVVVVGYGTQKKRDVTGSISQVDPADLNTVSSSNPANSLQGRVAGVSISTDNAPGGTPTIRIRGSSSITASNNPLIVVDGFPLVNGELNDINPNNIASMEVLKDASATAIYGSRGANGVIMITTKEGVRGQNNLSIDTHFGLQAPARTVETLDRNEFIDFINAAYMNQTGQPVYTDDNPAPQYNTDWQDVAFKDRSYVHNLTLTFDGGNEKTRYMLSGGYFGQDGLLANSDFERFNFRTNLDHNLTDWFKVGTNLQVSKSIKNQNNLDLSVRYGIEEPGARARTITDAFDPSAPNIINIFRFGWPTMPVRNEDGSFYYAKEDPQHAGYVDSYWNPVAQADDITNRTTGERIFGNAYAEFSFLNHFTLRSTFGTDLFRDKVYYFKQTQINSSNEGAQTYSQGSTIISENILTYSNDWEDHSLTVNGVYSYQQHTYEDLKIGGIGFPSDLTGADNIGLLSNLNTPSSAKYSSKLISWTSRFSYAYKDKYLLTVTGRYDGSTRFGKENKWGFFPSVGVGWRISDEAFMENLSFISDLKLRGSYGITGNQEIGNYKSLASLSQVNYMASDDQLLLGLVENLGNPDLKWERTSQLDIGLNVGLLNNRFTVSADYYKMNTKDLLYNVPIPSTSGYRSILKNIGEVQNQGFEVSADLRLIDRGDLTWNIGGNVTKYENEVVSLYEGVDKIKIAEKDGMIRYLEVGKPINGLWARKSGGIIRNQQEADAIKDVLPFAEPGGEKYVDVNGDGFINEDDYVLIGTTDPEFYYGLSTGIRFKNFGLDIYSQGATGIATPSTTYLIFGEYQLQNRNYIPSQYAYDRMWRENNPDGTFPRPGAKEVHFSDRSNGNRNYFIIKNIKLSYNVSPSWIGRRLFKDMTVYLNAQNYFSFTNFRGYNPESGSIQYPLAKSIRLGINASF